MDVTPDGQAVDDELVDGSSVRAGELDAVDEQLIARLAGRAREGGLALTGEGGLLAQLTKRLVESALEGRSPNTWATTATTPPAETVGTPATVTAPRPC